MAVIGLDLDGPIYPYVEQLAKHAEVSYGYMPTGSLNTEVYEYAMLNDWSDLAEKVAYPALHCSFIEMRGCRKGTPVAGATHYALKWAAQGHTVKFVTARRCLCESAADQKAHTAVLHDDTKFWLGEVGLAGLDVVFEHEKGNVEVDLLLDDYGPNLKHHNAAVKLLWHKSYNRSMRGKFTRVTEWREVDGFVQTLA